MKDNIERVVRALHGDGTIANDAGSGFYTSVVADYVLGFIMGTEWGPTTVWRTIHGLGHGKTSYKGKYVQTKDSQKVTEFEAWLAEMLNHLAIQNMKFGYAHPLSHSNWVTTDQIYAPLEQKFNLNLTGAPGETVEYAEDWMHVDARHIETTSEWPAGYYFNQHAYPYYPDFLKHNLTKRGVPDHALETTGKN
eukprot:Pgem_evm1s14783